MDNDIDMNLALLRILETEDQGANMVLNNVGSLDSVVMGARSDTPMHQSLESHALLTNQPSSPVNRDASISPSLQTLLDSAANMSRSLPNKPRSLSESDVKKAVRDASLLRSRPPPDIIVRDFAFNPSTSSTSPRVHLPTPILLALRNRISQPLYPASRIVPIRTQELVQLKSTLERLSIDSALPADLTPKHVGKHPIPYTMPSATDLAKILHPALVEAIQSSTYNSLVPKDTRCFCSLVLYEIQRRVSDIRLDIHGPRDHAHLQLQLRSILTSNEAVANKLLALYGDALRLHAHARTNARPMQLNS
ncbi:hypothetical protein yc1106_00043 [Curvularia clavata]|uniref:Uncharacterized protein n=1 Tax=Curvularia clavata TaxID=95742 RepID=A0A9Q8Z0Z1_CURCL|nr:hypothetical protein yc1106_00043 [Curvularia clavata]